MTRMESAEEKKIAVTLRELLEDEHAADSIMTALRGSSDEIAFSPSSVTFDEIGMMTTDAGVVIILERDLERVELQLTIQAFEVK